MEFQKVSLTEPNDIAIALSYIEKSTLSEKPTSNAMEILLSQKLIFTEVTCRVA